MIGAAALRKLKMLSLSGYGTVVGEERAHSRLYLHVLVFLAEAASTAREKLREDQHEFEFALKQRADFEIYILEAGGEVLDGELALGGGKHPFFRFIIDEEGDLARLFLRL